MRKMKLYRIICILSAVLGLSTSAFAQSYGTSENKEYYGSQEYYDSHNAVAHAHVKDMHCDDESGTIFFKLDYHFDGTPITKDITFVIDKYTYIPEVTTEISPDINKFVSGEHKWIDFYITPEDDARIEAMGAGDSITVHVDRIWDICKSVAVYPSPEEKARVTRLNDYGIMVGDENGKFNPMQLLTRAELTKIAVVMSNPDFEESVDLSQQSFSDVSAEHWAYPYVEYARANGIIEGYEDGSFKPETPVTAQEAVKMMISLLGYTPFAEDNGGYPTGYMMAASRYGVLENVELVTTESITRSEAAWLITNSLDTPLMVESTDAGAFVICNGSNPEYPEMTLAIKNFSE